IQVLNGKKHKKIVRSLSFTKKKLPVVRGFIFDKNFQPLAVPTELPSAAIDPLKLAYSLAKKVNLNPGEDIDLSNRKNRKKLAYSHKLHKKILELSKKLAIAIHEDPYILSEKLFESIIRGSRFLYIKRHIADSEVAALKEIKFHKHILWFPTEPARHYPHKTMASQILGFASIDGQGMEGIENQFNVELKGTTSQITAQRDARTSTLLIDGLPDIDVGGANHVVLTIDSRIQRDTEEILSTGLKHYGAKSGAAIVMDAKTGEILAMANVPLFDPAEKHKVSPSVYRNRAVIDSYELGSVVKPFTMLGAMAAGRINSNTDIPMDFVTLRNGKRWKPKDHTFFNKASIKPWQVLSRSSNLGIAKIAELLGAKGLYNIFVKLGFGVPTGIELPSEATGVLPVLKKWTDKVYLATHSYGHGFTISLIQLVQAYSVFANKGFIVRPHIVRYLFDDKKRIISCHSKVSCPNKGQPERFRVVRNQYAIKEVMKMMEKVVTQGTGTKADLRQYGYSVAGKTGTAEKVKAGVAYSQNHNRVTFAGLVPANDPKVVIAVMYDDPEGDPETLEKNNPESEMRKDAGFIAAPVFGKIAHRVMYHLGVPPDLPEVKIKKAKPFRKISRNSGSPAIPPLPVPEKVVMPDFTNKTLADVLEILANIKMECKIVGHGVVYQQYPEPGGPQKNCILQLKPFVNQKVQLKSAPENKKDSKNKSE
ncbi:MAG: penicillin-binding transpeptidase domain-containing protein, partial [Deltaproteobacteria bacterium]|nr:penicillin-binding transpeptidase domain-containing protein [Deltaproteobacteria bacterium]